MRILPPLLSGILHQWYLPAKAEALYTGFVASFILLLISFFFRPYTRYKKPWLTGIICTCLFWSSGMLLIHYRDIRNKDDWYGKFYQPGAGCSVTLDEEPVEKKKSFKVYASVRQIYVGSKTINTSGKILLYFSKKDLHIKPSYGSRILFRSALQDIPAASNPGGFDFRRFNQLKGVIHQVYLHPNAYTVMPGKSSSALKELLHSARKHILSVFRHYIKDTKVLGLAEALIVGYRDDIDPALKQSYTKTGVIHIIAISGLHLGLIYGLLMFALSPLKKTGAKWLYPLLVILGIWTFSLLTGAQPSVLRSALMFSCLSLGNLWNRKPHSLNSLLFSACLLLCHDPFLLWNPGFQLSYAAVAGILFFSRPIYTSIYIKNKILDQLWQLNAVTWAAQLMTLPVSIYHFQQVPLFFWMSNLLALPLVSLILPLEILFCLLSILPPAARFLGNLVTLLIRFMNTWIESLSAIPYAVWDGLLISSIQAILLFIIISGFVTGLLNRSAIGIKWSLAALLPFSLIQSYSVWMAEKQSMVIVYQTPGKSAMDLVSGRRYYFVGSSQWESEAALQQQYLTPTRTHFRIRPSQKPAGLHVIGNFYFLNGTRIWLADKTMTASMFSDLQADVCIVTKDADCPPIPSSSKVRIRQIVMDSSVPGSQVFKWKKLCEKLNIPWHDLSSQGAFVMTLQKPTFAACLSFD